MGEAGYMAFIIIEKADRTQTKEVIETIIQRQKFGNTSKNKTKNKIHELSPHLNWLTPTKEAINKLYLSVPSNSQ